MSSLAEGGACFLRLFFILGALSLSSSTFRLTIDGIRPIKV